MSITLFPSLRLSYKAVDNVAIPTDVYLPSFKADLKPCPVLIMIHGGAFMLGHAGMNNKDQIQDCLDRGWVVLALEHRLCPGADLLNGPVTDVRDALAWVQQDGLTKALKETSNWEGKVDETRIVVMGTSSGGHLALCTAFDTPTPPLAILDFYGAKKFQDPFWTQRLPNMPSHFYDPVSQSDMDTIHQEKTIFMGGLSLEGQSQPVDTPSSIADPKVRQAFAMHHISTGRLLPAIWPSYPDNLQQIDPLLNVSKSWPPIAIVHGTADTMIPMRLSKDLQAQLHKCGVRNEFIEVEGEPHTFCGKMVKGGTTWLTQRKGFDFLQKIVEESYKDTSV